MYYFKNGSGYINEALPKHASQISSKGMKGMTLSGLWKGFNFEDINIVDYIGVCESNKYNANFIIEYNGIKKTIHCGDFLNGKLGGLLSVDFNDKYIDEDGVVHIFIKNIEGDSYEALYSGDYSDEVMNSAWNVICRNGRVITVQTGNYNKTGKSIKLHQVDLGSWVDHINNDPLDNRIKNLRNTNGHNNTKNRKSNGITEITGIERSGNGFIARYSDSISKFRISTVCKLSIEEVKIDALIAQRYMGYRHNEDLFYLLDDLPIERIKEVEDLLEKKIQKARNKSHEEKEYNHDVEECDGYYKLKKNGKEMLFDCDLELIKNMNIWLNGKYWACKSILDGEKIYNLLHKYLLNLTPNEYKSYNIHVDHLNNNTNDNRYANISIVTLYSNQCNKEGIGYIKNKTINKSYSVLYMVNYKFWDLIGGVRRPTFKTEEEAIAEVERRRNIIDNARVKLKSKQELDELIQYCLNNGYVLENGLANLDLGYLYWKEILVQ